MGEHWGCWTPRPWTGESLHTFLPIPLLAPSLISCCSFLAGNASPGSGSRNTPEERWCQQLPAQGRSRGRAGVPLPPWGAPSCRRPGCERVPQANKKPLNISERSFSFPSTLISSPPPTSQGSQQSCSLALFPPAQHPETLPQPPSPARSCHLQTLVFFNYIFFFSFSFSFPPLAFSHAIRLPLAPLPLPPPQALGWPRGCEVRGGSGGCGGLCIDALIAHGLRLTSLLPGKQSPWLLALLLQRRL